MKTAKIALVLVVAVSALVVLTTPCLAEKRVRPFNRIVVMLDRSGSFKDRIMEAVKKAEDLVGKISDTKSKRNEGKDEVIIISLDAIPEVIWSGTKEQLDVERTKNWEERFVARSDYQQCTDIENGFILAARELHKEPLATNLYAVAFTDLINEPPAGSAKKCQPVTLPSLPSADFPWDAFADVETHVLWTPINQKQAWFGAIKTANLGDNFRIHSESESSSVVLKAPPKARHIMSEEEREGGKTKIKGFFNGIGRVILYGAGGFVILALIGGILTKFLSKNKRKGR